METSKRTITKKKILSKEKPPETAEKKKNKQTDQNQYLSESGAVQQLLHQYLVILKKKI